MEHPFDIGLLPEHTIVRFANGQVGRLYKQDFSGLLFVAFADDSRVKVEPEEQVEVVEYPFVLAQTYLRDHEMMNISQAQGWCHRHHATVTYGDNEVCVKVPRRASMTAGTLVEAVFELMKG